MNKEFLIKKMPLVLIVSVLVITAAIAQTSSGKGTQKRTDTTPTKKIRDLDEALLELDKGEAEMVKALKEIDFQKIEREIRASLKDIDMAKMKADLAKNLKELDMAKISADVDKALKEVDVEKIRAEVQQALKEIDTEKIKAEISKIKEVDMVKLKEEMQKIRPEIERSMQQAKKELAKARAELQNWKEFVSALEKDGLIKKGEDYKIEYKGGELTVNGKKQSADAVKKYSTFLNGKEDFTIKKEGDDFDIDN
jgi:hypothetical protein